MGAGDERWKLRARWRASQRDWGRMMYVFVGGSCGCGGWFGDEGGKDGREGGGGGVMKVVRVKGM